MEVQMPSYSSESNEDKMKDEGDYWQGEGDKMNERREDAEEDRSDLLKTRRQKGHCLLRRVHTAATKDKET